MKLQASKKALETNKTAPILPEKEKVVQVSSEALLKAQEDEFLCWLEKKTESSNFQFFTDMLKKIRSKQVLTPSMVAALQKCMKQDAEREEAKANPPKSVDEKDLPTVTLKMKQWWTRQQELGSRVITGKILRETAKAYFLKGYADMIEGTWCMRCGKELTEPASMVIGYGPTCCAHLGVPYPDDIKTASKKEREAIRKKLMVVLHNQTFEAWVPKSQIEAVIETNGKEESGK